MIAALFSSPRKFRRFLFLLVIGILSTITTTFGTYWFFGNDHHSLNLSDDQVTMPDSQVEPLNLDQSAQDLTTLNILLLGYGGAGHQGGFLTDVLQIVHLDFEKKTSGFDFSSS